MESITIKVEDELAREIEKAMKPYYSTKTEFIREAVRNKIKDIKKERIIEELRRNFGKAKTKTPLAMDRVTRKEVGEEFAKRFGINLD